MKLDGTYGNYISKCPMISENMAPILAHRVLLNRSYWRERAAFGRSTAGNDVVATIFISLFLFFLFFSPPSRPFLIDGVLGSKNLFSESCLERPKTKGYTPFQTLSAILGPQLVGLCLTKNYFGLNFFLTQIICFTQNFLDTKFL